jgi:hypothetical protein
LTFESFRSAVKPQFVVGRKLVMHLIKEGIYISAEFKSWSSKKKGGLLLSEFTMIQFLFIDYNLKYKKLLKEAFTQ